jgi:hypothetical protein
MHEKHSNFFHFSFSDEIFFKNVVVKMKNFRDWIDIFPYVNREMLFLPFLLQEADNPKPSSGCITGRDEERPPFLKKVRFS